MKYEYNAYATRGKNYSPGQNAGLYLTWVQRSFLLKVIN